MSSELVIVNAGDRSWTTHKYLFNFGAYGWTMCLVYANNLDDALDEAIDWIVDNVPGLLADDSVKEEYDRAIAEGRTEEEADEIATADTTSGGNCGNYLNSWEWSVQEDPSRERIKGLIAELGIKVAS